MVNDELPPSFPLVGDVVGQRYRLDRVLARGGMGMVYLATQLTVEREVAVKVVLPTKLDNELVLKRFEREIELQKQLRHPNVVELYDIGRTDGGVLYVVMELLEGRDLADVIDQDGPLSVERTGRLALQILDALAVAHQQEVVHRDLKPSNVFVTELGRHGDFVKLLDFGLAKALDPVEGSTEVTGSGQICGTSAYMPPEMFLRGSASLSVDVYALGLIVLEMLIGQRVVQGRTTAENMAIHLDGDFKIPLVLRGTKLEVFIRRAMSKRPDNRYRTAQQALEALEQALEETPGDIVVGSAEAALCVSVMGTEDVMGRLLGHIVKASKEEEASAAATHEAAGQGLAETAAATPTPADLADTVPDTRRELQRIPRVFDRTREITRVDFVAQLAGELADEKTMELEVPGDADDDVRTVREVKVPTADIPGPPLDYGTDDTSRRTRPVRAAPRAPAEADVTQPTPPRSATWVLAMLVVMAIILGVLTIFTLW